MGSRVFVILALALGGCGSSTREGATEATTETTASHEEDTVTTGEGTTGEVTGDEANDEATADEPSSTSGAPAETDATASGGPTVPPAAVCTEDSDCVLVAGDCSSPEAVDEPHARERARRNRQRLSVGECRGGDPVVPVRAVCTQGACTTTPSDHPEWRLCGETEECVIVPRRCGWDVVTVDSEAAARAAFRAEAPSCSRHTAPAAPRVSCSYGFCAFDWREP